VGSNPIRNDDAPITDTVISISLRRPQRSPSIPQITAPSGRAASPAQKLASDASSEAVGSSDGKNSFGKIVAATTPYNAKSNHSSAVPTVAPATARRAIK
jgi:hypothetical protein